jgi:uncharacterized protein (TIGR02996 family)
MFEEAFLQAIAEQPYDIAPRLVYADWLEERGDPRAQKVRDQCRYRLPIAPQEIQHLGAIAAAREQADAGQVEVATSPGYPGYPLADGPDGGARFAEDLRYLSAEAIARNFPRDESGRLQLGCVVLLAPYNCAGELPRGRALWLAATGPDRRRDAQVICVRTEALIGENHPHNWSRARWCWDQRHQSVAEKARWGITGAELRRVTGDRRGRRLAELQARWKARALTGPERIALCTMLQDDGKFEDALRVCEVEWPEELSRMLNAEKFALSDGCDCQGKEATLERAQKVRRALWESAPWRFAQALAEARADRPHKAPLLRLFILPRAPHARKPGLTLMEGADGRPGLAFLFTGSNVVAPETTWKRPVELDIARWCAGRSGRGSA